MAASREKKMVSQSARRWKNDGAFVKNFKNNKNKREKKSKEKKTIVGA